jgi:WD40 repeat protein
VAEIPAHAAEIQSVIFSPDGKTLAALRVDRTVKLFSTASGEELIGLEGFGQYHYSARFAPDSKTLVTESNEECRLWRAAADEP